MAERRWTRREWIISAGSAAAGLVIGGVVGSVLAPPKIKEVIKEVPVAPPKREIPKTPIKGAHFAWLTGPYSPLTIPGERAARIFVDKINAEGGILGRKIDLTSIDQLGTEHTVKEYRRMVEVEKVEFVVGPTGSGHGLALADHVEELGVPTFYQDVWTMELFLKKVPKPKYIFRCSNNDAQTAIAQVEAAKRVYPHAVRVALISPDYTWGRDQSANQQAVFRALTPDAEVVLDLYPPPGEKDYIPYITKLMEAKPELCFINLFAGDFLTFTKQAAPMGFYDKVPSIVTAMNAALGELKKEFVPEGIIAHMAYYWPFYPPHERWPLNKEFITEYVKRHGTYPTYNAAPASLAYTGYKLAVERAYEKLGEYPTADDIVRELEGMVVPTIGGYVMFRKEDHQAIWPQILGMTKHAPEYPFPILDPIYIVEPELNFPPPGMGVRDWIATWRA